MRGPFEKLPIFDELDEAGSFVAKAEILLQAPPAILGRYDMTLRNRLMNRGFPEALAYLDAVRVALNAVRAETGLMTVRTEDIIRAAGFALMDAARAHDARRAAEGGAG